MERRGIMITNFIEDLEKFEQEMKTKWGNIGEEFDSNRFIEEITIRYRKNACKLKDSLYIQKRIETEKYNSRLEKLN
ncbi:hypothetical protein [Bacillus massiliglaciei]|uniref:hypothetical protein n=1 Tax=Bacillus massiliglaciei TaxID=1816693 RepID=UPI000DA6398E|nr:hypothetical protein [Bacillus massiliglaciei]